MSTTDRDTSSPIYIYTVAPRCPWCNSTRLLANHTERRPTGTKVRHCRCQNCRQKIRLVIE